MIPTRPRTPSCTGGCILFDLDYLEDAARILTQALDTGQVEVMNSARAGLGAVRLAQGRLDEAHTLLATALETGNPKEEPTIRRYLGSVLARQGGGTRPGPCWSRWRTPTTPTTAQPGCCCSGASRCRPVTARRARRWLGAAIEAGDQEVEAEARVELGRILAEAADLAGSREILTPLLDQHSIQGEQASQILDELSAGERITPPALPTGRPGGTAPPALPPGRPMVIPPPGSRSPGRHWASRRRRVGRRAGYGRW